MLFSALGAVGLDNWAIIPALMDNLQRRYRVQRIHEPADLMEAQMLISMLNGEGIQVYLQGADLVGGMGELPALGLLALMVSDEDVQHACEIGRASCRERV